MLPDAEKIEIRTHGVVELVEVEERGTKRKKLKGYAARFNSLSEDLGGFREIIKPGAFDRAMREAHDVRALVNHNPDAILGRSKAGTLTLEVDEQGLRVEIDPPDTNAGRDILLSVGRGDVSGMSFAFRTLTDDWRNVEGEIVRELLDLMLRDVSVVVYPAYPAAEVSLRALDKAKALAAPPPPPPGVPLEVNEARLRDALS